MRSVILTACKKPANKASRVWIAGKVLLNAGFPAGTPYRVEYHQDRKVVHVTRDQGGARLVSRNGKVAACIDLQNATIEAMYADGERLQVVIMDGEIIIQRHHEDTSRAKRERQFTEHLAAGNLTRASMFTGGAVTAEAIGTACAHSGVESKLAWFAELEDKYCASAQANAYCIDDDTQMLQGHVQEIEGRYFTDVDVLSFGMPCAGFSTAGKSKHKKSAVEHSGTTVFGVVRAIQSSNPAVLISENVVEARDNPIYLLLKAEIERLGYVIFEMTLDSKHTDSLSQRRRYWFVAISKGIAPETLEVPLAAASGATLGDILHSRVPAASWFKNDYLNKKAETDRAAGKGFKRQLVTKDSERIGTVGRFYQKRRSTEPFLIRGDGKERLLTPVEVARAMSIPEYLLNGTSDSTAYQICGQATDFLQPYKLMTEILNGVMNPA